MPDQHLRLTVAYVGTDFRGWARQPGERTVEGELREALTTLYGSVGGLAVAGRTDTGVHALANVVSVDVTGGPPPERAAEALNAVLPADLAIARGGAGAPGLPRALQRRFALVSLPHLAPPRALAVRAPPLALASAPARPRAPERGGGAAARRARLPRLHAHRHAARRLRPRRRERPLARPRRHRRARDHRRLVPAAHGADARRDDARARAGRAGRAAARARRARPPARPPPPHGLT